MAAYADHDELLRSLQSQLRVCSRLVAPLSHRMMIVHDVGADHPHLKREPFLLYLRGGLVRMSYVDTCCYHVRGWLVVLGFGLRLTL